MDLIGSVLQSVRVLDSAMALYEFERPWGFRFPYVKDVIFLFSPVEGEFHMDRADGASFVLRPGDVGMAIEGEMNIRCRPDSDLRPFPMVWHTGELPPLSSKTERMSPLSLKLTDVGQHGDKGLAFALVVQDVVQSPVLALLPRLLLLPSNLPGQRDWLHLLQRFIESEVRHPTQGYNAVARQLMTTFSMVLLREHLVSSGSENASWLRGMNDPFIGPALAVMHGRYGEDWSLAALARESGLARSTFCRRFEQCVGESPMRYLSHVRMQAAALHLLRGDPVTRVAHRVGYRSEWAFRRSFVATFGRTPTDYVNAKRG